MSRYIKLLRVKHYVKNLIIFFPLFFSGNFFELNSLLKLLVGFIIFSLGSSIIYVINDINDVEKDKLHPTKCHRPLASGIISIKEAKIFLTCVCIIEFIGIVFSTCSGVITYNSVFLLMLYILLNIAYSRYLKKIPIVDIAVLSSGFVIRLYFGSLISNIIVSELLYLTVLGVSLYMSIGKRRNELVSENGSNTRDVLNKYSYEFLDKNMYVALAFTEVCYTLWTLQTPYHLLVWTVPVTMFIAMKYSLIIESKDSEANPIDILFSDKPLIIMFVILALIIFFGIYI